MWAETVLVAERAGREPVAAPAVPTIDEAHHLARAVTVVVLHNPARSQHPRARITEWKQGTHGRAEGVRGDVPALAEDSEVRERRPGRLRRRGENGEDRGVDVVLVDAADMRELLHSVLVRHVASEKLVSRIRGQCETKSTYLPAHATTSKGVCSW